MDGFSRGKSTMELDTQCRSIQVSGYGMISRFVREPIGFSKGALTG